MLTACALAAAAPPKTADHDDPFAPLDAALIRVEAGASLNLRSLGSTGTIPHRYLHLTWRLARESPEEVAILGEPRVVEAIGEGGRDLLTTAVHRVMPEAARAPSFAGPFRQGESAILDVGVTFEHAGDLPARLERVMVDVDVAAKGDTVSFNLAPQATEEFTTICDGIDARVVRVGFTDPDRGTDRFALVEYRLVPATEVERDPAEPEASKHSQAAAAPFSAVTSGGSFRAPIIASIDPIDDLGRAFGRAGLHQEAATTTGRFGMVLLLMPPQSEAVAIRIEANPAAEVRRVRLRAVDVDSGG